MMLRSRVGQAVADRLGFAAILRHPIVVGGTGGSGTRAIRDLLIRAGVAMGTNVNGPGDALDFEPMLERWINRILESAGTVAFRVGDLPRDVRRGFTRQFHQRMRRYLRAVPPGQRWGWKNPRSIYILPLIHSLIPGFYFVHVLRDGRDMAISSNQNQYRKHFASLFRAEPGQERDPIAESCTMWARVNSEAADWCEKNLGRRYVRIRLEELCARPELAAEVFVALGLNPAIAENAAAVLKQPASVGRWKSLSADVSARLTTIAAGALRRFGYE